MSTEYRLSYTADEIDEKLGKIKDIDLVYNSESENPQSGTAVAQALENATINFINVTEVGQ